MPVPDHFGLFGLPERFEIDQADLERRYRELSQKLHPDKQPPGERLAAVQKTADLNAAYKTLRDDFSRAEHILRRHGVETSEKESHDSRQNVDPVLLMEVLELRETLEHAKDAHDRTTVEELADDVNTRTAVAWKKLRDGFVRGHDYGSLGKELTSLRYYRRVLDEVSNILDAEDA